MAEPSTCLFNPQQSIDEINTRLGEITHPASQTPEDIFAQIFRLKSLINEFEAHPKALDQVLQPYISTICKVYLSVKSKNDHDRRLCNSLAELVYLVTKIRGYKFVINYFSSDVYLFDQLMSIIEDETTQKSDFESFFVLLWLSKLVLVPFPLRTVKEDLPDLLYIIATRFLSLHSNASKTQVISSILLSSLLTRNDCKPLFESFQSNIVENWATLGENSKLGQMMTINQVLKKPYSDAIAEFASMLHPEVIHYEISRISYDSVYKVGTLNVTFLVKLLSKCARFYIADANYDLVAKAINSIVNLINAMSSSFDAALRECAAKNLSRIVSLMSLKAANYSSQLVDYMVSSLNLKIVPGADYRYRLEEADLNVSRYHTILLFLGFLALTKELPYEFVPKLLGICHSTLYVSPRTFSFIQDTYIRDASCFCLWAVWRMLKPMQFGDLQKDHSSLVNEIFLDMIKIPIFDDNYLIRRCGLAVLQEFVGRFGTSYFNKLIGTQDEHVIGEFTVAFMELFGTDNVMSLKDSHQLIERLIGLGFDKSLFYEPLLDEVVNESSAFALQKIGGASLAKIMATDAISSLQLSNLGVLSGSEVKKSLFRHFLSGSKTIYFTLGEFSSRQMLETRETELVVSTLNQTAFNHRHEKCDTGEAFMHWINCCSMKNSNFESTLFIEISKVAPSESLIHEFQKFFALGQNLPDETVATIFDLIRWGNHTLAASIPFYELPETQKNSAYEIIRDRSIEAELRGVMIRGFQLQKYGEGELNEFIDISIELLDDYTLNARGDVGSLVRCATIDLLQTFVEMIKPFSDRLEPKLLQISGEGLDKPRVAAFQLLCSLKNVDSELLQNEGSKNDYDNYFATFFRMSHEHFITTPVHREAFWKGITHSAGATTGGRSLINKSFKNVLRHLSTETHLEEVWLILLGFLRIPPNHKLSELNKRRQKLINNTLTIFVKIFESGLRLPSSLNFSTLHVRAFNLHINTQNAGRIESVLKIFQHLSLHESAPETVRKSCRQRLCLVACDNPMGNVRLLAVNALLEIAYEKNLHHSVVAELEETDWDRKRLGTTKAKEFEKVYLNI